MSCEQSRVARVYKNMAEHFIDVSALRIGENPLQKFEDILRVSLDELKGRSNKHLLNLIYRKRMYFVLNILSDCFLEESKKEPTGHSAYSQSDVANTTIKSQTSYWNTLGRNNRLQSIVQTIKVLQNSLLTWYLSC